VKYGMIVHDLHALYTVAATHIYTFNYPVESNQVLQKKNYITSLK
jgi:hypothetical protein